MKNQALFSSKDKSKNLKCCLLQFLFGILRANTFNGRPNSGGLVLPGKQEAKKKFEKLFLFE